MKTRGMKTEQGGFIVIVVLCMVMMLSVLLLDFHYEARTDLKAVDDFRQSEQALHCSRAGINIAIAAIKGSADNRIGKSCPSLLARETTFAVGKGRCSVTISEESGKLNINFLKDESGKLNQVAIEHVLRLFDLLNQQKDTRSQISYGLVPSIMCEATGAESRYYSQLKSPYACKNAPFEIVEELLQVKGMTPDVFDRLSDYVTVYGDGRINVNYAPALVLQSLSEEMDAGLAQLIVDRRQLEPFGSVDELKDIPGITESIYSTIRRNLTVEPANDHYHVISQGSVGRFSHTAVAILNKNVSTNNVDLVLYKEL